MKKEKVKALINVLTPLILLTLFTFAICFPDEVPFLKIRPRSSAGIGTVSFTLDAKAAPGTEGKKGQKIKFSLKQVPPGISPAGCTDVPGRTVVYEPFLLGETEVTIGMWEAVMAWPGISEYVFTGAATKDGGANLPVANVSWRDAVVYCNALSIILGFQPVYYLDPGFTRPVKSVRELQDLIDAVSVKPGADGFRLPMSMEWELAARYIDGMTWTPGGHPSGSETPYYEETRSQQYAVFRADAPAPVKTRASNALGIYDMSGNVWEWCFNEFVKTEVNTPGYAVYDGESAGKASDAAGAERKRVVRGGGWIGTEYRLQVGGEFGSLPDLVQIQQGFRIAKSGW